MCQQSGRLSILSLFINRLPCFCNCYLSQLLLMDSGAHGNDGRLVAVHVTLVSGLGYGFVTTHPQAMAASHVQDQAAT